eukprot:GFKZ01006253.1.p1 GENE.GFKZ01006253.1~~GFKZ01006253.1.p1  ORF type:complete len:862 (+),score=111.85 GFKZ01006253.1:109-2586(+)
MSVAITPGTPSAHARQIRSLVTSLGEDPPVFPGTLPPFHTLTAATLPTLLPPLFSALHAEQTFLPSLSLLNSLLTAAAPLVLSPHISLVYQKLAFFLQPSHSPLTRARVLAIVANLLRVRNMSGERTSPVLRSSLSHASKALHQQFPALQLSAIAAFLAALQCTPKELREHLPLLNKVLPSLFAHPNPKLSHAAATLYAHLVIITDQSTLQSSFQTRLSFLLDRLDDIHHLLDRYAGLNAGVADRNIHADIHVLKLPQLASYYTSVCTVLKAQLGISVHVKLPIAPILHSLMRGFAHRQFDPYVNVNDTALDVNDAVGMSVVVSQQSMVALAGVLHESGKVLMPFAEIVAAAVERKLGRALLSFRSHGGLVGLEERVSLYRLVAEGVEVFGAAFLELLLGVFVDLFGTEVAFHAACIEAARPKERKVSVLELRRRKHRRNQRNAVQETKQDDDETREAKALGVASLSKVRSVLEEGLQVCIAIFNNRGFVNTKTVEVMEKLEGILGDMADGQICDHLIQALGAAALGGGASRLKAAASPLLFKCARRAAALALDSRFGHAKVAMQARSACEAVFHSRGPPIMKSVPNVTVERVDKAVPNSGPEIVERGTVERDPGRGPHGSVPMVIDSPAEDSHEKTSPGNPTPSGPQHNGFFATNQRQDGDGNKEARTGAPQSKRIQDLTLKDLDQSKDGPEQQLASTVNPEPKERGGKAALANAGKKSTEVHAHPVRIEHSTRIEKNKDSTATNQTPAGAIQSETEGDVIVAAYRGNEAEAIINDVRGGGNGSHRAPTSLQPENIDKENQDLTLDADEDAIIASIRFEPSDDE